MIKLKKEILVFDTEDDTRGNMLLCDFFDGQNHFTFYNQSDVFNFLSKHQFSFIWAHNLEYDLNNIFSGEFEKYLIRKYFGARLISAQCELYHLRFYDFFNHYKSSLETIGKKFGIEKIAYDFNGKYDKQKLTSHCQQDTFILWTALNNLIKFYEHYNTGIKSTAPSNALNIFISNFLDSKDDIIIGQTHYDREYITDAYYGGRVEAFDFNEHEKVFKYDINSSYPFAMLNELPDIHSVENNTEFDLNKFGVAKVKIELFENYYGGLPYRKKYGTKTQKIIFPIGIFESSWTYPELRYIIENRLGKILEVISFVQFGKGFPYLKKYAETFFNLKKESKTVEREFFKILLNSLYGKFAEKGVIQIYKHYLSVKDSEKSKVKYVMDNIAVLEYHFGYSKYSNIIWSAYITGYARIYLFDLMLKYFPIYVDTDSLFCLSKIGDDIVNENIGGLKFEGVESCQIFGNKMYRFGNHYVCKGIPKEFAKSALESGNVTYKKPIRFRESNRRVDKKPANYWIEYTKNISMNYDKRKVLKNLNSEPIRLGGKNGKN